MLKALTAGRLVAVQAADGAGNLLRELAQAWRSRHANPLLAVWALRDSRLLRARPWYRRNPFLLWTSGAASLVSSAIIVVSFLSLKPFLGSALLTPGMLKGWALHLAAMLFWALIALTSLWLINAVYALVHETLNFVADSSRKRAEGLDDLIAITQIGDAELLMAILIRALNRVAAPLSVALLLQTLAVFLIGLQGTMSEIGHLDGLRSVSRPDWYYVALSTIWTLGTACLSSLLGTILLVLLLMPLARGLRGLSLQLGVLTQFAAQLAIPVWISVWAYLFSPTRSFFRDPDYIGSFAEIATLGTLALLVALYALLRMGNDGVRLRRWLLYGAAALQILMACLALILHGNLTTWGAPELSGLPLLISPLLLFQSAAPLQLLPLGIASDGAIAASWQASGMQILLQLILLAISLGPALAAIRLRRRSAA